MESSTSTKSPLRLLVAEDSEDDFELLLRQLRKGGFTPAARRVTTQVELDAALTESWDLVISDWMLPGFGGRAVLDTIAARHRDLPCIVVSGTPGEEPAVEALRAGALDFLSKDRPARLVPAVERALREAEERRGRAAAERELRFSEQRYRTAFELAPEALLTYDLDEKRILDANGKAQALFKKSRDELRAVTLGGLSPEHQPDGRDSQVAGRAFIDAALAGGSPTHTWWFQVEGELIPCESRIFHLPTAGRNLAQIRILDLRERIRSEEIRRRSAELEQQNRRIQEANRLKSEFLANMSHELRTPLNAIIGFAELLFDGQVDPGTPMHHEFLGDILTSGRHLLQLINDVLDLAKVEAGKLEFRPETFDIGKPITEVVAILRTTAAQKQIRLETQIELPDPNVTLDPGRLKQVIYNYLSNALKFTSAGGRVIVRVKPEGSEQLRLEVEDTGIGIAAHDLGRLFLEFHQLEAGAAKRHQGTGLGLALTRRLVEAQGGSVGVKSTLGVGSTFHAVLPRHTTAIVAEPPRITTPPPIAGARTVLVVEDDARDQAQLVATLASAGYAVDIAGTGAEAIERWRARSYDAITIDLLLPDMNGIDLLARLHAEQPRLGTPIIVVTVVGDAKVVAGFPVHDVLHKPLDRDSLIASLARAVPAQETPRG